jgi:Flp pilus assembly protein TadG
MSATGSSTTASRANRTAACRLRRRLQWILWDSQRERGAGIMEMAFVSMFFFMFIAGIVDLGGAFQHYIITINASREGARTYARLPCLPENRAALHAAIISSAVGEAERSGLTLLSKNVTITPDPAVACPARGDQVRVTVQDDFDTLMGVFWDATTFPVRAQTSMMFYGADEE